MTIVCLAVACSGTKKLTEPRKIKFSHGGGFSGAYTSFIIDENGNVEKSQGVVSQFSKLGKLKKETTKQLFSFYDNAKLGSIDMMSYSNMNYSITMMQDSSQHKLMWENNQAGSENIQKFYDIYMKIIENELLPSKVEVHNE